MPDLTPFQFDAHDVRIHLDAANTPWWVLTDTCAVLGLTNPSEVVKRLKTGTYFTLRNSDTGHAGLIVINEQALYRVIFRSNKPEADRFQDWVFDEVLPQLRKTGAYHMPHIPQALSYDELRAHRTFLEDLGLFDDRDRLLLADIARTQLQRTAGMLPAGATALPMPQGFDVEQALRAVAPTLTATQLRKLTGEAGKRVAKEYRLRHGGNDPTTTARFIDGKARDVNWYAAECEEWVAPILQSYLAPRGLLPPTT